MPGEVAPGGSVRVVDSPAGPLLARASAEGLTALVPLDAGCDDDEPGDAPGHGAVAEAIGAGERHLDLLERELADYARGSLRVFSVPLDLPGAGVADPAHREVYREIAATPFGETTTYGRVAEDAGLPRRARLVGRLCRLAPMVLVLPVHRVVRADGTVGGCRGEDRAALLRHERAAVRGR